MSDHLLLGLTLTPQIRIKNFLLMCKTKMGVNASEPKRTRSRSRPSQSERRHHHHQTPSSTSTSGTTTTTTTTTTTSNSNRTVKTGPSSSSSSSSGAASSSVASRTSLASLRESLPENPHIYNASEIRAATNNFLAHRLSSSSSKASWRCNLRGREVVVFQRKFRRRIVTEELRDRLSDICRSHHGSIIKLLGASVSGDHIYLVYEYVNGASLADCLRNPKNPNFTVLSNWTSRIQIATDLAHGLDYIHNKTGLKIENLVHNHIKSSAVIVTEPDFNAKICHFGTAQLCGETDETTPDRDDESRNSRRRSDSRAIRFEGVRGYMSPEFQNSGTATQKSDVYAFGVMMLELLSGEEPLKYRYDKSTGDFERTSVIETARAAVEDGDGDDREGRVRRWMDGRLGDSFPVTVVEKLTRLALDCVEEDPVNRPEMGRVAGKISQLYLESEKWSANMKRPTDITVSFAPR